MNSLTIRSIENDVITITDERLLSLSFADDVTTNDSFDIGSVIISQLDFEVVNFDGLYDDFEFYQANVVFTHNSQLICTTVIDKCVNNNGILDITAFDYLSKADVEFDELQVTLPTTAAALMAEVCRQCDLTLLTTSFSNGTYPITRFKDNVKYSCRVVMGYIAQIAGCWVKADANGRIVLDWYDKTGQPVKAINNVSDTDIFGYDITITGLSVKAAGTTSDYGETVTAGTDVYMLKITDNPLIVEGTAQDVLNGIKDKIIGLTFRPLSCAYISDWTLKPGQKVTVTARGNTYTCYVNSINNKVIGSGNISCEAARPSKMKMESQTAKTEAIARDVAQRQMSGYISAMNNFTDLMSSALGLFHTEIIEQNGSTTHYWHNEEDLEDSQIQYKFSVAGFGVSHDYGQTWIAGIDAQGNILATVLTAIGVQADWVVVGSSMSLTAELNNLQDQIDNNIQTYSGTAVPTTSNYPANTWSEFDSHIGNLYYISSGSKQGYCYRFMKNGNVYGWTLIKDTDLTTVLNALTVDGQIAQLVNYSTTTQMQGYVNTSIAGLSSVYSTKTEVNAQLSSVERENLTPYPYYSPNGYTNNGITYTVNSDGSITANGTATENSIYYLLSTSDNWYLDEGTYTLSGSIGGSSATYRLQIRTVRDGAGITIANSYDGGATFNVDAKTAQEQKYIRIYIVSGTTVNNVKFYPMLEKGSAAHEYVPTVSTPTNTYNSLVENVSRIDQTATGISARVTATEQQIVTTNQNLATTNQILAENVSRIDQTANQISTRVSATEQQVITAMYNNFVKYPYQRPNVYTNNGITYTVNADGSITANGTATARSSYHLSLRTQTTGTFLEKGKTYTLSGCPSGGGDSTYNIALAYNVSSGGYNSVYDNGSGVTFTVANTYLDDSITLVIYVYEGTTVNNVKFYPMLEKGSAAHPYEPTTQSNLTLANGENTSVTYENLLPYPYYQSGGTSNGITYTINADGSVTANGTSTATSYFVFAHRNYSNFKLAEGTYTLSGCPSTGGDGIYRLDLSGNSTEGTYENLANDYGQGATITLDSATASRTKQVRITIWSGVTLNNVVFKPMLERGMTAHSYQPTPTSQSSVGSRMTTAESSITQNANNIALKVSQTDYNGETIASLINQSASTVAIQAAHIKLEGVVTANNTFKVDTSGNITATGGKISGFSISDNTLTNASTGGDYKFTLYTPKTAPAATANIIHIQWMYSTAQGWVSLYRVQANGQVHTGSDRRIKRDIHELTSEDTLILLKNIIPQSFRLIGDNTLRIGFIAQDVIKVLEDNKLDKSLFVNGQKNETGDIYYTLNYMDFIGVLWKGWQEHEKIIEEQQAKINDLEERLKKIEDYLFKDEDEIIRENLRKRGIDV